MASHKIFSISFLKKHFNKLLKSLNQLNIRPLVQEQSLRSSSIIAVSISIAYILYLFPLSFLAGRGGFFEQGMPFISVSGFWNFMADSWRFPLLKTQLLNYPQGVNIAFTNSLPILALLFKPFKYWLPKGFHYFGAWFAISYMLQAVSSVLLFRALGQRTLLAAIAAASMALMMPAFLWQFDQIALVAQGTILLALTLYFAGFKNPRYFQTITVYFTGLLSVVLLIHPYLFAMTMAIYLAFLSEHYLRFRREGKKCLVELGKTIGVIIVIALVTGYLTHPWRANGYGYYSMNLFAPVYGGKLGGRFINATGGQQAGYNYLGMGVIAALLFTAVTRWQWLLQIVQRYRILTIVALILVSFALSNHIFYGSHKLFHYGLFEPFKSVAATFRTSGRMFWPVGYLLMVIGLLGVLRFENKQVSVIFTLLILGIQFYDTQNLRHKIYRTTRQSSVIQPSWHRLMRSVSAVHVYPAYGCGGVRNNTNQTRNIAFFQGLAARHGRPINTSFVSRGKTDCRLKHRAFNKTLTKGHLYIVTKDSYNMPTPIANAMENGWCRRVNQGTLCVVNTDHTWWKNRVPSSPTRSKNTTNWFQRFVQGN